MPRPTKPREKKKPRALQPEAAARPLEAEATDAGEESEGGEGEASSESSEGEGPASEGAAFGGEGDGEESVDDEPRGEGDDSSSESDSFPEVSNDGALPGRAARSSEDSSMERFDPLSAYLREVQRHPLLQPEETQKLAEQFVKTQDARAAAQLVTSNLRLVVKIAYEYRRAYKNIMDLIQEGNIGLMQAVKRYDPYRGVKLSSYAAW
ncbi:MAG TPA: sigma-70 family RNA polymerase sigma factor, partial [Polyangiaceae bacterium]|nr:sigma-70 family RNA polymerase sigma factor [Polyangiaceae bacterium]